MEFKCDKTNFEIARYSFGYGSTMKAKPIYLIRCKCGQPVKVFIKGKPAIDLHDFGFNEYSCDYTAIKYKNSAWAIMLKEERKCPECERLIYYGLDKRNAVESFVRGKMRLEDAELDEDIITDLMERIEGIPDVAKFVSHQVEEIARRPEGIITVGPFNWSNESEFFESLNLSYGDGERFERTSATINPFDFTDEIMAEHGEECTCSLCME